MEVERYKMIFTKIINKEIEDKLDTPSSIIYINHKIEDEIYSDNIRILGHDFVKNNKNKAKLIINNKKYNLKEFINDKDFKSYKIKINMILSKDISNISHMFKNCAQLLEISIDNDKEPYKFEEFLDCNIDYNEGNYEDKNEYIYNNFYNNNYIYSNCSEITKKKKENQAFLNQH